MSNEIDAHLREIARIHENVLTPTDVCAKLVQWGAVANITYGTSLHNVVVSKSDLLGRLLYGKEKGPSQTRCPVHKGIWSGCHYKWPGAKWSNGKPIETGQMEQEWYDAGCRCFQHRGSNCTTGWNPDEYCCLTDFGEWEKV